MQTQLATTLLKVDKTLTLQLKWCRTFIDIGDEEIPSTESSSSKRRSKSEPARHKLSESSSELFGGERAYIASLATKLAWFREHYQSSSETSVASTRSQGSSEKNSVASFCGMSMVSTTSDFQCPATSPGSPTAPVQEKPGFVLEIADFLRETTEGQHDINTNELVAHSLLRAKAQSSPRSPSSVAAATEVVRIKGCNPGSLGHPELCMRPCIYFATGGCSNGEMCEYCHMGHPKRPVHLDKRHREMLRGMTLKDTAAMLHPVVRSKAEALRCSSAVNELLDELARKCDCDPDSREPVTANRQQRMLVTTLRSMSLRSLLTTFGRVLSEVSSEDEAAIDQILTHMRGDLTAC